MYTNSQKFGHNLFIELRGQHKNEICLFYVFDSSK